MERKDWARKSVAEWRYYLDGKPSMAPYEAVAYLVTLGFTEKEAKQYMATLEVNH